MWPAISTFSSAAKVQFVRSGKQYFDLLLELIQQATQEIHLQVYIFNPDGTGKIILDALENAVKRNVEVYLVVDGYGSQWLTKKYQETLQAAGIKFKAFAPLIFKRGMQAGRRLHQKIIVVDGHKALVSGINIADKYNEYYGKEPWLDFGVFLEGTAAKQIRNTCIDNWQNRKLKKHLKRKQLIIPHYPEEKIKVKQRVNDWLKGKHQISTSYRMALKHAKKEIIIMASYFLPGFRIRWLLRKARNKGVVVRLILPHLSDVAIAKYATSFLYAWLLRRGIKIYEWQPSIVHGKIAVIDNFWVTVGSYNLNHLSDYASLELNMDIADNAFALNVKNSMQDIIKEGCKEITHEDLARKNIFSRLREWLSFHIVRALIGILFFFTKSQQRKIPFEKAGI